MYCRVVTPALCGYQSKVPVLFWVVSTLLILYTLSRYIGVCVCCVALKIKVILVMSCVSIVRSLMGIEWCLNSFCSV